MSEKSVNNDDNPDTKDNVYVVVKKGLHFGLSRKSEVPVGTEITLTARQAAAFVNKVKLKGSDKEGKSISIDELSKMAKKLESLEKENEQLSKKLKVAETKDK